MNEHYSFGDIILIYYPFSDLSKTKKRPCLVLKDIEEDILVMFISSRQENLTKDDIMLLKNNFNNLMVDSVLKLNKVTTLHKGLVCKKLGILKDDKKQEVKLELLEFIKNL